MEVLLEPNAERNSALVKAEIQVAYLLDLATKQEGYAGSFSTDAEEKARQDAYFDALDAVNAANEVGCDVTGLGGSLKFSEEIASDQLYKDDRYPGRVIIPIYPSCFPKRPHWHALIGVVAPESVNREDLIIAGRIRIKNPALEGYIPYRPPEAQPTLF